LEALRGNPMKLRSQSGSRRSTRVEREFRVHKVEVGDIPAEYVQTNDAR
jgi:hypothetical protein